jgi:hypothetical protein
MDMFPCRGCGQLIYQDTQICPKCQRLRSSHERDWDDAAKRERERRRDALPGKLLRAAVALGLVYVCWAQRALIVGKVLVARAALFAEYDRVQKSGKAAEAPAAAPAAPAAQGAAPEALPEVGGEVMDIRVTPPAPKAG